MIPSTDEAVVEREKAAYAQLLAEADQYLNSSIPKMVVKDRMIELGQVVLSDKYISTLSICNTGAGIFQWQVVTKPGMNVVCPAWMTMSMVKGDLLPEEEALLTITVCLRPSHIEELLKERPIAPMDDVIEDIDRKDKHKDEESNVGIQQQSGTGSLDIEEIIIIRAVGGSDVFCVLSCHIDLTEYLANRQSTIPHDDERPVNQIPSLANIGTIFGSMQQQVQQAASTGMYNVQFITMNLHFSHGIFLPSYPLFISVFHRYVSNRNNRT